MNNGNSKNKNAPVAYSHDLMSIEVYLEIIYFVEFFICIEKTKCVCCFICHECYVHKLKRRSGCYNSFSAYIHIVALMHCDEKPLFIVPLNSSRYLAVLRHRSESRRRAYEYILHTLQVDNSNNIQSSAWAVTYMHFSECAINREWVYLQLIGSPLIQLYYFTKRHQFSSQ